jgi:hypothetical protein
MTKRLVNCQRLPWLAMCCLRSGIVTGKWREVFDAPCFLMVLVVIVISTKVEQGSV